MKPDTITTFDIDERVALAVKSFESGFNCCQAVFLSFTDLIDIKLEVAQNISLGFGGGMGQLEETCGTFSALVLLTGLRYPIEHPDNPDARTANYEIIQRMAKEFKHLNHSINCRALTNQDVSKLLNKEAKALELATRPCSKYVADAARIAGRMLKGEFE